MPCESIGLRVAAVMGMAGVAGVGVIVTASVRALEPAATQEATVPPPRDEIKGWKKGKGWGWVWGKDDEVGAPQRHDRRHPRRGAGAGRRRARSTTWA